MTTSTVPTAAPLDEDDDPSRGWNRWRVLAVALVVVPLVVFWAWAFSPWAPDHKADSLSDKSFVPAANATCRRANAAIAQLPLATEAKSAVERAAVLDQSNADVAAMIAGLRIDAVRATGRDKQLLDQWLTDWDSYFESRVSYAAALRANPKAEFRVSGRTGGQITETMDGFSRTNRILECLVPLDV